MVDWADFPVEEFDMRYARARTLMVSWRLDALLVTQESNYIWFTGHRSVQNSIDKVRPFVCLLPLVAPPIVIYPAFEHAQVARTCHVKDLWPVSAIEGTANILADALRTRGLEHARIGMELGHGQYLGIAVAELEALGRICPNIQIVDASYVFFRLRAVKSRREQIYLRRSCELNAEAQAATASEVRPGMTEIDVARILRGHLVSRGADSITFLSVISPEPSFNGIFSLPTERRIDRDQMLSLDVGVSYHGYCSDVARMMYIGEPPQSLRDFCAWMLDLHAACVAELRPGRTPADVAATCNRELEKSGRGTIGAGRIGHGVGLESTEFPSIAYSEDIVFEAGMTLACNPNFVTEHGFVNTEDNWLVTNHGADLLSRPQPVDVPITVAG